ncbi:hypothetical protein OOZ15_19495 [Galbibacter sp. EGI 63066]|uniref:hypothetical protein n=1 Tax=Galbibacter sp. EGI 63066 TaxID=2993559 RepID=UPI0022496707|nr:hypothetical protein [Galbibacter sp. EGI 63066]MCX2682140.1 hypothetical protein [Galbibacter sp. EGI 63066]
MDIFIRMNKYLILLFLLSVLYSCNQNAKEESNKVNKVSNMALDSLLTEKKILSKRKEVTSKEVTNTIEKKDSIKCNIDVIVETYNNVSSLDNKMIELFLLTFDSECINNVEYMEFSNEVLFKVLHNEPGLVLKLMSEDSSLERKAILNTLANPINDEININDLINRIENIKTRDYIEMRNQILDSLKKAKHLFSEE